MSLAERRRWLVLLAGVFMVSTVTLVYSPWAARTLVRDDHVLVAEDAPFRTAPPLALFTKPFWPEGTLGDTSVRYYRPLVLLSLRVDAALGGTRAELHFTNVFLHAVACLLLAVAAIRLGATGRAAVVAALVWGLAPRLSESVAWVSGRTDVLAAVFVFAALAVAPDVPARPPPDLLRGRMLAVLSGLCLFAALASKEVAVAGAAALAVLAWRRRRVDDATPAVERLVRPALGIVVPSVIYAGLRFHALAGSSAHTRDLGPGLRALTVLEAVGRYVEMTADALRPRTVIGLLGHIDAVRALLGVVALVAVATLIAYRARNARRSSDGVAAAVALGGVALGLVLHVVPISTAGTTASDRFLYLPLAALALGAAVGAQALPPVWRSALGIAALVMAIPFALATRARARDYEDELRFWLVAAETGHPANMMPFNALANALIARDGAELGCVVFERARAIEERTEQANTPVHRRTREGLAGCLALIGRYEDAAVVTDQLVAEHPAFGRGYLARGFAHLHTLDFDGAKASFERARELEPSLATYVDVPLDAIARARVEWVRYADPAVRAKDDVGYAAFLQRVGRLHEATDAALVVALDENATPSERASAASFLAVAGSIDKARVAAASFRFDESSTQLLAARERRLAALAQLEPRINRLVDEQRAASLSPVAR
jgi:tetratricopeptide (TPR) repeat protein